ncbi:MAG: HDOD domain-containing protein [Planctomycetota bacterium]
MTTATANEKQQSTPIDELVRRARSLYSLPAVAAEVIQLTSNPKVDARALKECIQTDPALTAKLLRVVNSSLFGLSREVCDLNQALALLGTKPLKLLVLGFSLPENLFAEVAREQLDWYWSTTLTRAVAAREISEQLFDRPGDDAFLAGLFQDIGVLVLLGELQEPYADFLSGVIDQRVDLQQLEMDSLGFDHLQLTSALLEHWNMPQLLVKSLAEPRDHTQLIKSTESHAELARVVHMAELVAELVGQNRLGVLPDLMEVGEAYCSLEKEQLNELVESLQPKVKQLAEVLSLESACVAETDFKAIVAEAHQQMSELAEEVVELLGHPPLEEEQAYSNLLADATRLRKTVDSFLSQSSPPETLSAPASASKQLPTPSPLAAKPSVISSQSSGASTTASSGDFTTQLTLMIGHCRSRRQPVSLIVLELGGESANDAQGRPMLAQVLELASRTINVPDMICETSNACRRVFVLPARDRHEAVQLSEETLSRIERMVRRLEEQGTRLEFVSSAGVASVALPPKNFPPQDLLETAERCLSAAQSSGVNVVKSLEIY